MKPHEVERWAWQSPEEAKLGLLPPFNWWTRCQEFGHRSLHSHLKSSPYRTWRIVMRLYNGQLVIAKAKP